jgi:esterase/lipase
MPRYISTFLKVLLISFIITTLLLVFWPAPKLESAPISQLDFATAKTKIESLKQKDIGRINPECGNLALLHPQKQLKSIVIYHGFTNCPKQFSTLGQQLFEQGYNVFIPRLPYHGFGDLMNNESQNITSKGLVQFMRDTYEITKGLGDQVETMGISGGGNLAAWSGLVYDAYQVLAIAPLFAPTGYPNWQIPIMRNYVSLRPNEYKWWDDKVKDKPIDGPTHAYPRYSSKAANAFLEIALDLQSRIQAKIKNKKLSTKFKLLTLEGDKAIDNNVATEYFDQLDEIVTTNSTRQQIPASKNLNHDIIDPMQPQAKTGFVYPLIIEMLGR